jgi:hypothetical protein
MMIVMIGAVIVLTVVVFYVQERRPPGWLWNTGPLKTFRGRLAYIGFGVVALLVIVTVHRAITGHW